MAAKLNVITGATGLLGSHLTELLVNRGERVRVLVRPGSDTSFLRQLGVELIVGDLRRPSTLSAVLAGTSTSVGTTTPSMVVYHCAARVGDWGSWSQYQEGVVDATAHLLDACAMTQVSRVVHVSSVSTYGRPPLEGPPIREEDVLGCNLGWWDHYARAKILAEAQVRRYPGSWTIVRPSWIYGPRDRTTFPRVLDALFSRRAVIVGSGENRLNIVYVSDIADGVLKAGQVPEASGRIYNLSSEGAISQREFLNALTDALALPRITRRVPYSLAYARAFLSEAWARLRRQRTPPALTRYAVSLLARPTRFSSDRARLELGWSPKVTPLEGLRITLDWHFGRIPRRSSA